MFQNTFGPVLFYFPFVGILILWILVFFWFKRSGFVLSVVARRLFILLAVFWQVGHSIFFTAYQYYLWSNNSFTQILLKLPLDEKVPLFGVFNLFSFARDFVSGYFVYYSLYHFWLPVVVGFFFALIVYLFCLIIQRIVPDQVSEPELWFICYACLLLAFPLGVVFLIIFFGILLLTAIISTLMGQKQIVVFWPMVFASFFITLGFYNFILGGLGIAWLVL